MITFKFCHQLQLSCLIETKFPKDKQIGERAQSP